MTPSLHGIRIADRRDEQQLLTMAAQMHALDALKDYDGSPLPIDEEVLRYEIQRAVIPNRNSDDAPAWIGVIGAPGALEASIYLSVERCWYSARPLLQERWNYCLPEYRRHGHARTLINFAKEFSRVMQMRLVIGVMTTGREEAKVRFLRRHLGNPIGTLFSYSGGA